MDVNPTPQNENNPTETEPGGIGQVTSQQPVVPPKPAHRGGIMHKLMPFISLLLFGSLIGAGVWYYQEQRLQTAQTNQATLETKVANLETQLQTVTLDDEHDEVDPVNPTNTDIATGQVTTGETTPDGEAWTKIAGLAKGGSVDELWVEYGQSIADLDKKTDSITDGLGAGDADSYGHFVFTVLDSELNPGEEYFYRVAGKMGEVTVYGGIAAFTSLK